MKVKCIDNKYFENQLTIGKIYNIIDEYEYSCSIINDNNTENIFLRERFKTLSEYINDKIDKLLEK